MLLDQIDRLECRRKAANMADRKNCTQSLIKGLTEGYYVVSEYSHILSEGGGAEIRLGIIELSHSCARNQANKKNPFSIDKVIFNDPATIIFWSDGTKTVVKCGENEPFDPEKGLAMAIAKKALGNEGNYYNTIREWLPEKNDESALSEEEQSVIKAVIGSLRKALFGQADVQFNDNTLNITTDGGN